MTAIGGALGLVGMAVLVLAICIVFPVMGAWHLFEYVLRVRKPIQATAATTLVVLWAVGAIIGFA